MKKMIIRSFLSVMALLMLSSGFAFASDVNSKDPQAQKAVAVLNSLASGDKTAITNWVNPNQYIQHNGMFPDGRDAVLGALPQLKAAGTKVNIKRVLVDSDYVVLHTEYNLFGPKAGFDIFRFENGQIVEHARLKRDGN